MNKMLRAAKSKTYNFHLNYTTKETQPMTDPEPHLPQNNGKAIIPGCENAKESQAQKYIPFQPATKIVGNADGEKGNLEYMLLSHPCLLQGKRRWTPSERRTKRHL